MVRLNHFKVSISGISALAVGAPIIEGFLRVLFQISGLQMNSLVSYIDNGLFAICYLGLIFIEIHKMEHKSLNLAIVISFIMAISFIASIIIDPDSVRYSNDFRAMIFRLPIYIYVGSECLFSEDIIEKISKYIPVALLYSMLAIFFLNNNDYSMAVSYYMLPIAIVAYLQCQEKKTNKYFAITILLALVLLLSGKRMVLLCYLFYIGADIIVIQHRKSNRVIVAFLTLFVVFIFLFLFDDEIALILLRLFPDSKAISTYVRGEFFSTSGRNSIYALLISSMKQNPVKVRGLYSDRVFFSYNYQSLDFWVSDANRYSIYAHNVFLEIVYDYGIIIGGFIVLLLVTRIFGIFKRLWRTGDLYRKRVILFIFSFAFLPMMVSRSYLAYYYFGFL